VTAVDAAATGDGCGGWLAALTAAARDLQRRLLCCPPQLLFPSSSVCPSPRVDSHQEASLVVLVVVPEGEYEQAAVVTDVTDTPTATTTATAAGKEGGFGMPSGRQGFAARHQQQQQGPKGPGCKARVQLPRVQSSKSLLHDSYRVLNEYLAPLTGQVTLVQQAVQVRVQQQQQQQQVVVVPVHPQTPQPAAAAGAAGAADVAVPLQHDDSCYVSIQGPARLPPQLQVLPLPPQQQQQGLAADGSSGLRLPQRQCLAAVSHCVTKSEVLSGSEGGVTGLAMSLFLKVSEKKV
jgi:hypothetical protein